MEGAATYFVRVRPVVVVTDEVLGPGRVHLRVSTALGDELLVRAELDDLAVVDDCDAIGAHRGGESVRHDDRGTTLEDRVEAGLHQRLRLEVEVRRRLVEHEHARPGEERAGERDELPLTRRERHAAFVHRRVEPLGEPVDEVGQPDAMDRLPDLVVGGVRLRELDVVADVPGEEERLLRNDAQLPAQRFDRDVAQVVAVDGDAALGGVVEPRDELGDGRLPGTRRADERHRLPRRDVQVDVGAAPGSSGRTRT